MGDLLTEQGVLCSGIKRQKDFFWRATNSDSQSTIRYLSPGQAVSWPDFCTEVLEFVQKADCVNHIHRAYYVGSSDKRAREPSNEASTIVLVGYVLDYLKEFVMTTERVAFSHKRLVSLPSGEGARQKVEVGWVDFVLYSKDPSGKNGETVPVMLECKRPGYFECTKTGTRSGLHQLVEDEGSGQVNAGDPETDQEPAKRAISKIFDYLVRANAKYGILTCGDVWWVVRRRSTKTLEVSQPISWSADKVTTSATTVFVAVLWTLHKARADETVPSSPARDIEGVKEDISEGDDSKEEEYEEELKPEEAARPAGEGGEQQPQKKRKAQLLEATGSVGNMCAAPVQQRHNLEQRHNLQQRKCLPCHRVPPGCGVGRRKENS